MSDCDLCRANVFVVSKRAALKNDGQPLDAINAAFGDSGEFLVLLRCAECDNDFEMVCEDVVGLLDALPHFDAGCTIHVLATDAELTVMGAMMQRHEALSEGAAMH